MNVENKNENSSNESVLNLYNPLNKSITLNELNKILNKYNVKYKIDNLELYERAFVHKSYLKYPKLINDSLNIKLTECPNNCLELKSKSNERLEFLGDGVLELITKYYLYKRFPKADEGFMTEKKIAIVNNEHIGKLAYELKLNDWLIISKHSEEKNIRKNYKKLGCLFEAFIGAIFLDVNKININDENNWFSNVFTTGPGFQMAQIFVESVFENHIDWNSLIENDANFKNKLQVIIQKEFKTTPEYIEIEYTNENGYLMGVYLCLGIELHEINNHKILDFDTLKSFDNINKILEEDKKIVVLLSKGLHKIKKKAEQIACEKCLQIIN